MYMKMVKEARLSYQDFETNSDKVYNVFLEEKDGGGILYILSMGDLGIHW